MELKHSTYPRWVLWIFGVFITGIAVLAGGTSLAINVVYGLQTSVWYAIIYFTTDLAKIGIPVLLTALAIRDLLPRLLHWGCVAMSIGIAFSFWAETGAISLSSVKNTRQDREGALQIAEDAKAKLAKISELLAVPDLDILIADEKQNVDAERKRGGCRDKCKEFQANLAALLARKAEAQLRDALKEKLAEAQTKASKVRPVIFPGAAEMIAARTGVDVAIVADRANLSGTVATILLMEGIALLIVYGVAIIALAVKTPRPAPKRRDIVPPEEIEPGNRKHSESQTLLKLQMMIWNSPGEEVIASRPRLASEFGVPSSTMKDWVRKWAQRGEITIVEDGNSTKFRTKKRRAVA